MARLPGLIFTFVWSLDVAEDRRAPLTSWSRLAVGPPGGSTSWSCCADQETRLGAGGHAVPARAQAAPSATCEWCRSTCSTWTRGTAVASGRRCRHAEHRFVSEPGEHLGPARHLAVDNRGDDPAATARRSSRAQPRVTRRGLLLQPGQAVPGQVDQVRGHDLLGRLAGAEPPLAGGADHADQHLGVHRRRLRVEPAALERVHEDALDPGGDVADDRLERRRWCRPGCRGPGSGSRPGAASM